MAARKVTMIKPGVSRSALHPTASRTRKRVAGYARVSTDFEEQLTSYEAQVDYYTRYIQENPDWQFVSVYTDEGISATSTKKRDGFNRMIADALAGKIDLILTKSVSRFARNTVDTLTTVRKLKEKGVEVYFEKENIYTMDSKGELLITIMSSLAQEESRSISENVTWGQRKRFADGKVSLPYKRFLGYEKGENGFPQIVESQAKIVRYIYQLFLEGNSPCAIARRLIAEEIPTPGGKKIWQYTTVESILTNEKYKGDARLQKSFTVDYLTKKKKTNEGEVPQYYVENSHPAIIKPDIFDIVQYEFKRRKGCGLYSNGSGPLTNRLICEDCGNFFGAKQWHSDTTHFKVVWQCRHRYQGAQHCQTGYLSEDAVKQAFLAVFNGFITNRSEIFESYEEMIHLLTDTAKLDGELDGLRAEHEVLLGLLEKCIQENASTALDQEAYRRRYEELAGKFETAVASIAALEEKKADQAAKAQLMRLFLSTLAEKDTLLTEFDDTVWYATMDSVTVKHGGELVFHFKDGTDVPYTVE